jgi:hypothetical protein
MSPKPSVAAHKENEVFLRSYLIKMGLKLDCYSLSRLSELKERRIGHLLCGSTRIVNDESIDDVDSLINKIEKEVPGLHLSRSGKLTAIINVQDASEATPIHQILHKKSRSDIAALQVD